MNISTINVINDNSAIMLKHELLEQPKADIVSLIIPDGSVESRGTFTHTVTAGKVEFGVMDAENMEMMLAKKAELAKANLTNLMNKLTITDVKEFDDMGMGSINETEVDELVNVVEEIKIMLATYCEDYVPTGNLDMDKVKSVTGSVTMAAKVMKKLTAANMPFTKDNITEITNTVNEYRAIENIDNNTKRYLVKNELEPTVHNLYKAKHSGYSPGQAITGEQFQELKEQALSIIKEAGIKPDDRSLDNAKLILEEGAPLTKENLELAESIDNISLLENEDEIIDFAIDALKYQRGDAKVTAAEKIDEKVKNAVSVLNRAGITEILSIINESRHLTINNLSKAAGGQNYNLENEEGYVEGYRALTQARLVLTASTLITMEKLGVDTINTPLNQLVDEFVKLKPVNETMLAVEALRQAPVNVLTQFTSVVSVTITEINQASAPLKWKLDAAGATYETFGTQIRGDLGDNLNKAVSASAESMLNNMGFEGNRQEVAAVKILAANHIEVTAENVVSISEKYVTVSNIINNISPQMVLDMIRGGQNPLKMNIKDLSNSIDQYNEENGNDTEGFAKFLYKLEKQDDISASERADYIGMYRILNAIKKEEAKSLGAVVKEEAELTLNNMITAYISRKRSNIDKSIGENTEFTQNQGLAFYKNIFSECVVMDVAPMDEEYYQEQIEAVKEAATTEESIIRILTDNEEPVTISNVLSAMDYKNNKVFKKLMESEQEDIKQSIRDMSDSMDSREALNEAIADLDKRTKDYLTGLMEQNNTTHEKLMAAKDMVKNVSFLSNLAKKQEYQIPVSMGDALVNVNLKLVKAKEDGGKMNISFETESFGKVSVDCLATKTSIDILAVGDNSDTVDMIRARQEAIIERIVELGFEETHMSVVESSQMLTLGGTFEGEGNPQTAKLYQVAKIFISSILPN